MSAGVFVLKGKDEFLELRSALFPQETNLQEILERYPALLAGDQVNPDAPRRWILVSREQAVPSEEGGSRTWSLDHLFLDQDGVPTFVEVKLQNNTDLRRKVVGQMLEYAANGVAYWSAEDLRTAFEGRHREDSERVLADLVGEDVDASAYWLMVRTNLEAGRIRMMFIADLIPHQLRRIVEFLNEQMSPAEVLALELQHYRSGELRTIVPRLYGQTEAARQRKAVKGPNPANSNYQGIEGYENIKNRCEAEGDKIVVGFIGGTAKLRETPLPQLENRKFKWDRRDGGHGSKVAANWISGTAFRNVCLSIETQSPPSNFEPS